MTFVHLSACARRGKFRQTGSTIYGSSQGRKKIGERGAAASKEDEQPPTQPKEGRKLTLPKHTSFTLL
jgi:hypothetical protein